MKKHTLHNPIAELEKSLTKERVHNAKKKAEDMLFQINLSELRKNAGLTQQNIRNFSQSGLSKIEARNDLKISTLKNYLHSIGMILEIKARVFNKKSRGKSKEFILLKEETL